MHARKFVYYLLLLNSIDIVFCGEIVLNHDKLWAKLSKFTESWSKDFVKLNKPKVQKLLQSVNVTNDCRNSIYSIFDGIENLDEWAVLMKNSWGNFPASGLFEGTVTDLGAYDQCLSIADNQWIGSSQYCMLDMSIPLPKPMPKDHNLFHQIDVLPDYLKNQTNNAITVLSKDASFFYWLSLRLGICLPDKCNFNDVKQLTESVVNEMGLEVKKVGCEKRSETKLNSVQISAIVVILSFIVCCVLASIYENFTSKKKSNFWIFVDCFSIQRNIKRLLTVKTSQNLSCIHGLRFWTLLWIIYGHTVLWNDFHLFGRTFNVKKLLTGITTQPILNAGNSVDTFFMISGILTSYISFKTSNGKLEKFNIWGFFIARYLRLTPQLAIFMLITFLLPIMGSGPIWHEFVDPVIDRCYYNWWQNFLYLQNLIDVDNMCLLHCWFLATDMQMHFISFFVVFVMLYKIKLGLVLDVLFIIAFFLSTSYVTLVNHFPPVYSNTGRNEFYVNVFTNQMYFKPMPHGISFFIGLGLGYIIYKNRFVKLSTTMVRFLWITVLTSLYLTLSDTLLYNDGKPYNIYLSALIFPSARLSFAISVAATIWLCISGNGGVINKILSNKTFVPFARLTYSTYLTHSWSIWLYMGTRRQLIDTTIYSTITIFLQHCIISFVFGAVFSLIFENPILNLLKYVLKYFKITENTGYEGVEMRNGNDILIHPSVSP